MQEIHIMSGPPASGKSTVAKQITENNPNIIHMSRDVVRAKLREELGSEDYFPTSAAEEWRNWMSAVNEVIKSGKSVVIDQTTLGEKAFIKLCSSIIIPKDCKLVVHLFTAMLATCQWRNGHRTGFEYVPPETLRNMHNSSFKELKPQQVKEMVEKAGKSAKYIIVITYQD